MIEQLLLVAGPSGAGKTTFMEQLAAGELPREIVRLLPEGAGRWKQTTGKEFLLSATESHSRKGGMQVEGGLVFHYDMMRPYSHGFGYADDPALTILHAAQRVQVINILPPASRLREQFASRASRRHPQGVRRLLTFLGVEYSFGQARLLKLYANSDRVCEWYGRWLDHIESLRLRGCAISTMTLVPAAGPGSRSGFELRAGTTRVGASR